MKSICISASDLAVVVGINKYQKLYEIIIKLWQKNYQIDYDNFLSSIKQKHDVTVSQKESDIEFIKRVQAESNLDFKNKVNECLTTKDTSQLLNNRNEILKELNNTPNLNQNVKDEFKKSLESVTNKTFGTINEKSVIEHYIKCTGNKVNQDSKFIKRNLCIYKDIRWIIGGRIDGITDDNIVVEIKNRIYKLFGEMRDYEKPQIQAYMYILGLPKGHLVESIKKNGQINMNIIEEDFDIDYWNNVILIRLNNFIKLFHLFLENSDLKTYILLGDDYEKEITLSSFLC